MLDTAEPTERTLTQREGMQQSAWATARTAERFDTEMIAWMRIHLSRVFETAPTLSDLKAALAARGLYLRTSGTDVWLLDRESQVPICTCAQLGFSGADYETRFGAPRPSNKRREVARTKPALTHVGARAA